MEWTEENNITVCQEFDLQKMLRKKVSSLSEQTWDFT